MKVWQLELKVYIKSNITMEEGQTEISQIIDSCLTKNEALTNFHNKNQYKNYTFSSFYPIEKNKIYQTGKIYTVTIRTVEEKLINHFQEVI